VTKEGMRFIEGGGLDVTPLRQLIEDNVDERIIKESEIEFIMGTFSLTNMKEVEITAKEAEEGYLKDYLMASSYFPLFKNEKLHGKKYLDGGIVNNVPIDMLINRGYKNIIVIRIYGIGMEKKIKIPEDVNVIYMAPKINLCNIMEFNNKKAARNITLGYYDAMRILRSLAGNYYYIDTLRSEKDFINSLINLDDSIIKELMIYLKKDNGGINPSIRFLMEELYPSMAAHLKLGKNWEYINLYFSLLERCAKKLKIKKFKIYTENELCNQLREKLSELSQNEIKSDIFMNLALSILS
jgi:NTE family protein